MRLTTPKVKEITPEHYDYASVLRHIERCGRVSYKSEDKITTVSYRDFFDRMKNNGHLSVLEHGTVYLSIPKNYGCSTPIAYKFRRNKYSCVVVDDKNVYITTNMRVIVENKLESDLNYMCEPTEFHKRRRTFLINTDRGVSSELNRHRANSPTEQSTRYCNFSKDKFSNEIAVMRPQEITEGDCYAAMGSWMIGMGRDYGFKQMCKAISCGYNEGSFDIIDTWLFANMAAEWAYMRLLKLGWKPEQARRVLPLDLSTELAVTAFESDWQRFLKLRSSDAGATGQHPDMDVVANRICKGMGM